MILCRRTLVIALPLVVLAGCNLTASDSPQSQEMQKLAAEAVKHATHAELATAQMPKAGGFKGLSAICLDRAENILACDDSARVIKVISPDGELLATWEPGIVPQVIAAHPDGTVFVGGKGKLAKLDSSGKVLKTVSLGSASMSGMAVTDQDLFVTMQESHGFELHRLNHDLEQPKRIARNLRGCCGTRDISAYDGHVYVAENSRHRVARYDREGKRVAKWGTPARTEIEGFGGCCNPMNLCLSANGEVITAEAGPDRVKRYSADGKYLGLIGWFTGGKSCSCVDLAISKDGSRVYVGDTRHKSIRVLALKEVTPTPATATPADTEAETSSAGSD